MLPLSLRTGGQTGVDRAALDIALQRGLPYTGWCPHGGWAEDYPTPPGLLTRYPHLTETPSPDPKQRTAWNVRDSHATLILLPGDIDERFPGTLFTQQMAVLVFLRPCLMVSITRPDTITQTRAWLEPLNTAPGGNLILNVAGPRESEAPGIYTAACRFLEQLLDEPLH